MKPSCKAHFEILTSLFDKINGFLEVGGAHSGRIEVLEKTLTGSSLLSAAIFCSFAFPLLARLFHSSALTESLAQATLSGELIKLVKLFSQPTWPNCHAVANQE